MPRNLSFTLGGSLSPRTSGPANASSANLQPGTNAQARPPVPTPTPGGASRPSGSPVDPVDVQVGAPTLGDFQAHQDAAYQQATRSLDPQWEANKRQFDQTMINQGLTPGSEAYNLALDQHNRGRTDAYASAQNYAVQQGQQAQQQAFQQNYMESELANQLLRQREGNETSIGIAGINASTAANAAEIGRQNFLDQLGFNQSQAGTAADQWAQQFAQSGNQWDRQFGLGQQNSDFQQMMQMMGFDRDTTQMGNQNQNQQFNQLLSMFGMMPQAQGAAPVDYLGALNSNQNQQNQNYATGTANANQQNANYMQILGYFMCSAALKDIGAPVDTAKCLQIALDLPLVNFTYKADVSQRPCVGTIAEDFNTALHGEPAPGGEAMIKILDMFGVLLGAVQELGKRYADQAADLKLLRHESGFTSGPAIAGFPADHKRYIATHVPGRHAPLLRPVESPA